MCCSEEIHGLRCTECNHLKAQAFWDTRNDVKNKLFLKLHFENYKWFCSLKATIDWGDDDDKRGNKSWGDDEDDRGNNSWGDGNNECGEYP